MAKAATKVLTCIVCPVGCTISVKVRGAKVLGCEGNTCVRGAAYAHDEILHPKRTLTSSVLVIGGRWPLVSVRTSGPVPKGKIGAVMKSIKCKTVRAPVQIGEVIIKKVAGTEVDIVATKTVEK